MSAVQFGIDAASFQGAIDWAAVSGRPECSFGFEKVTEGTGYVNPFWPAAKTAMNAQAKATGFVPGAYMFLDASPGAAQADHFAATAGNLDGWAIAIDVEAKGATLAEAKAAVTALRGHYPHHPIIGYIPHWFWGTQETTFVDVLWASHYVTGTGTPPGLYASVPGSWWDAYGGRVPALLQFTDGATVPGVSGAVDCSAFRGTVAELRGLITNAPPAPAPPPPPPPPAQIDGYLVTPGAAGGMTGRAVTSEDGGKTWH